MTFVFDESVDFAIGKLFQKIFAGTILITDTNKGVADETVIEIANKNNSGIVTFDKDFGELLIRQNKNIRCLILIRLKKMDARLKLELIESVILKVKEELDFTFIIITPVAYRIRKLK